MTKKFSTKRALIVNALSLLVCVFMLMGTTFAWFTDTISVSVAELQTGKLEISIVDEAGEAFAANTLQFLNNGTTADVVWEPNSTYSLQSFSIKNNGDVPLKFKVEIPMLSGSDGLLQYIEFVCNDGTADSPLTMDAFSAKEYKLGSGATSGTFTITGSMSADAPDTNQGLKIEDIQIIVKATQDNEDAEYPT